MELYNFLMEATTFDILSAIIKLPGMPETCIWSDLKLNDSCFKLFHDNLNALKSNDLIEEDSIKGFKLSQEGYDKLCELRDFLYDVPAALSVNNAYYRGLYLALKPILNIKNNIKISKEFFHACYDVANMISGLLSNCEEYKPYNFTVKII